MNRSTSIGAITLLSLTLAGCNIGSSIPPPLKEDVPKTARMLTMRAPEMFCMGCTASVEAAVGAVPGVLHANAEIETKEIRIIYDSAQVSSEEIIAQSVFDVYGREFISDELYSP